MPPEAPPRPGLLRYMVFPDGYFHAIYLLVRTKTFSAHVVPQKCHDVRKTGLSTHAGTTLRQARSSDSRLYQTRPRPVSGDVYFQ